MAKKTASKSPDNLIINQVTISTLNRQVIDIGKYIAAIKRADNVTTPSFVDLYSIYENVLLDGGLRSAIGKRKSQITNKPLEYIVNGKEIDTLRDVFESNKFLEFLNEVLDTISFGHTLIQFDYSSDSFNFSRIERRNVNPKKGIVTKRQGDAIGIDYRNELTLPLLEISTPDTLNKYGLLAVAAQYVIYKRNNTGDWAQHNEIYGQPIREGIYDANDEQGRTKLKEDMEKMGGSSILIHPKNTEINLKESSSKSATSDLYHTFHTVNDLAITILYLGNNLTTNSGDKGARSLGEVQEKGQEEIIKDDKKFLLGILNSEPFKTYFALFYPEAKNGKFQFREDTKTDRKTKADIYQIASEHVPIPDKEWYELMEMSVPEDLEALKQEFNQKKATQVQDPEKKIDKNKDTKNKGAFNFFG